MARFLPPQPHLDHLKNEAKALHKAREQRAPEVCPVLRHLHRLRQASDEEIFSADVTLTEVQFALAMDYGFASWDELRRAVLGLKPAEDYDPAARDDALLLPNPPPGLGTAVNRFAAGFSLALSYMGADADAVTVAGDSGLAFLLQADSQHHPYGTNTKQLDMGWWPLDSWGAMLRLDFLGRAYGIPMRQLPSVASEYGADHAAHYHKYHQVEILRNLHVGRPVVAVGPGVEGIYFICGYDGGDPPLLGQVSCETGTNVHRMEKCPWQVILLDEPGDPIDRRQSDADALGFALRLGRDEVDLSHLPGKLAGRSAWQLWREQVNDSELCGPHFYHANVVGHLIQNRTAAAAYLRAMSTRHPQPVGDALINAASMYDTVLATLRQADTSEKALAAPEGRNRLISLIDVSVDLENKAQERMAQATKAMRAR